MRRLVKVEIISPLSSFWLLKPCHRIAERSQQYHEQIMIGDYQRIGTSGIRNVTVTTIN